MQATCSLKQNYGLGNFKFYIKYIWFKEGVLILIYLNHEIEKEETISETKKEGEKWFPVEFWQMQRTE